MSCYFSSDLQRAVHPSVSNMLFFVATYIKICHSVLIGSIVSYRETAVNEYCWGLDP